MRTVIIKLGGSLVVPDEIDIAFLKQFKELIEEYANKDVRFGIIVGGGKICRKYQNAAKELGCDDNTALDWLGIETTKLNANLIKTVFKDKAFEKVITNPEEPLNTDKKILVGAGYKPTHSTDNDAVLLAENIGSDEIIVLSNIEHVYDKDPKKFSDAKPFDKLSWNEMLKLCAGPWEPGLNTPLDPTAAKMGAEKNHKIIFLNSLYNLKNYLDNKDFIGTIVE